MIVFQKFFNDVQSESKTEDFLLWQKIVLYRIYKGKLNGEKYIKLKPENWEMK